MTIASTQGVRDAGPRRRRRAPSHAGTGGLILARLRRGTLRQAWVVSLVAVVALALGLWFHTAGGANLTTGSALIYAGVALAIALALGLVREIGRNTVTSIRSLAKNRRYIVLGAAPQLSRRALRLLAPDQRTPLGCLINEPASQFAAAFRDAQEQVAADGVVAVIGVGAGDGATTTALCLAASAAQQGRSVVILDCDLRRRSLTRRLEVDPQLGVREACERPEYWREYLEPEPETALSFIPAARLPTPWRTLVGEAGFPALLQHLREAFDLVVLDCPPAHGAAEGPALARFAGRCVLVACWDQTPLAALRHAVRALRRDPATISVFVNRVPPGYRFGRVRPD